MTVEQALWEGELERAVADLANAERYDDRGMIEWNQERIRWCQIKIKEYMEYEEHRRRGA
ncbi:hypothetical protein D3C81_2172250 [compost metagenome]